HIRSLIDSTGYHLGLLRAGVLRRPHHLSELCEQRVLHSPLIGSFCDTEVDHFGYRVAVMFHHQHVRWLEVAMDQALLMLVLNGMAHGKEQLQSLRDRHPFAIAILSDGYAFDILHHEVRPSFSSRTGIEYPCDIRVVHHG